MPTRTRAILSRGPQRSLNCPDLTHAFHLFLAVAWQQTISGHILIRWRTNSPELILTLWGTEQGDPVIGDEILKRYFAMEAENDHMIGSRSVPAPWSKSIMLRFRWRTTTSLERRWFGWYRSCSPRGHWAPPMFADTPLKDVSGGILLAGDNNSRWTNQTPEREHASKQFCNSRNSPAAERVRWWSWRHDESQGLAQHVSEEFR